MAEYKTCPDHYIFGLDIGTRSIVGTVGFRENEKSFRVVGQVVRMHERRSMLDGQIHDIEKVAETISKVKADLEEQLQIKLEKVCIAAAGRVLKTVTVHVDYDLEDECVIQQDHIHSLELLGMETAYGELKKSMEADMNMYCVGSTVIHYYLDDFIMLKLEGHRGRKISADFLATFLPDEVITSLYSAVEKAGLSVANLTLEPIAASELAIPENFRLLNIALVDVGAGTSDISITKDGSIIGYGMIPIAGDKFTEEVAKQYLVDFDSAERIKLDCMSKRKVTYKDIMGITHKVDSVEILDGLKDTITETTKKVADKIKELNGGSAVSAVFIVGGGGKIPYFAEALAEGLGLAKERVAVRGEEVFSNLHFEDENVRLDSTLVTPIGICLSYLTKNSSFIMVSVNGRQVKLYDNNKLTVMDAAIQIGFPKENLFPKRGKEITFTLNNETRVVRGEAGEGAKITVNGKEAGLNTKISEKDIIEIDPSTAGKDATCTVGELAEYKRKGQLEITVNEKKITCPKMVKINGSMAVEQTPVCQGDRVEILDYYFIEEVLDIMDVSFPTYFLLNGKESGVDDRIYDGFTVECVWEPVEKPKEETPVQDVLADLPADVEQMILAETGSGRDTQNVDAATEERQEPEDQEIKNMTVQVNETEVVLSGKANYRFVDVFDFYPFDTKVAGGTALVTKVNGMDADFTQVLHADDKIELYWVD